MQFESFSLFFLGGLRMIESSGSSKYKSKQIRKLERARAGKG